MGTPADQLTPYVFLSYASADRERALHVASLLEAKGISVWIDRKSIPGGTCWTAEIVEGIKGCAALLVLISPSAAGSPNVQQEVQLAWEHRRPLLPLVLEATRLPAAIEYVLAGRQWIEVLDQGEGVWLTEALRALAGLGVAASSQSGPSSELLTPRTAASKVERARHNLPAQLTSFIGRERELIEVESYLQGGSTATRLLTLTGTGGCGKTRLALEVGRALLAAYPDGVWLSELAPLADPVLIAPTVAAALGIHEEAGRPVLATLLDALRSRQTLLLLDNCEHLLEACAKLADAILRGCPEVKILATSREALGIAGEVSWRVPSLAVPDGQAPAPVEDLLHNEAIRLFVERAKAVLPSFTLTSQNASAVSQICQRLDGIPLALELAAARLKGLSVEQLAARLDQRFRLLTGGSRAALPRHQTLAATVGWSYDLLSEPERTLFQRLAVFVGGFTLEAAEAVCAEGSGEATPGLPLTPGTQHLTPTLDVLDMLLRLVEKSLVIAEPVDDGTDRYHLLETLRQYALEKLLASGRAEASRERHAAHYLALAERGTSEFSGLKFAFWHAWLRTELNNVRVALRWTMDVGEMERALQLAGAMVEWLYLQSQPAESRRWLTELLVHHRAQSPTPGRGRALVSAAKLARNEMEIAKADALLDEALAILRAANDLPGIGLALAIKAEVAIARADYPAARAAVVEAASIGRAIGNQEIVVAALYWAGQVDCYVGDYAAAQASLEEASRLSTSSGIHYQASTLDWLGHVATGRGDFTMARFRYAEAMRQRLAIDRKLGVAFTLSGFAGLAAAEGDHARAVRLSAAAARLCELSGVPSHRTQEGYIRNRLPEIRATLGTAAYESAWSEGRAMTLEQAVAYALYGEVGHP
jgi:non-specific serine/threonine protein kinase